MVSIVPQRTASFVYFASPCESHCLRLVFALAAPCGTMPVAAVDRKNYPKTDY